MGPTNTKHRGADIYNRIAVFVIAKGGLMYEASLSGQKLSYEPATK